MKDLQRLDSIRAGESVLHLVDVINASREELSEIDGAIGDGDHGINMSTGFTHFRESVAGKNLPIGEMLEALGTTLLEVTGGSLGPLYGSMFLAMSDKLAGASFIDSISTLEMLQAGRDSMMEIGGAKPGDKTLVDCLCPAVDACEEALNSGADFCDCLTALQRGAAEGKESTRDMVARIGRASRLGERSRGVLDAGATSCCIILTSLADSFKAGLKTNQQI